MITFLLTIEDINLRSKLEEIYLCYHKELFITAYSILKDYHEAEDVVQTTIIKVSNNIDKISEVKCKKTRAYLVIIVRNLCYDIYNRKKGITTIAIDEISNIFTDDVNFVDNLIKMEQSKEMLGFLNELNQDYTDILTLKYYYELTISEIAEMLNITENNVSVKINRAKKALKDVIQKGGALCERTV
ncbi:RNA polymerase sigma-70 factor (ECF subfamily) [Natranaerovirga hydrolytica]|uniref:RNA polymerase sigma-70 factor (ECF subfamily) n=1 Tax=Natranaerovirga hydrolytica TaxID=680378 RepID=A0A4R1MMW4_9FIRM|nr:sigma-70 family RNA polymerase sigma factor [Natranaerovirga hydrolytica]TCK92634.1 RNA polymerase sigma-70 factor (ECF subfamily) [Natranaerovirga hydrolytica]